MSASADVRIHAVIINPNLNMSLEEIAHVISICQAVKQKRGFSKSIALRARWKEEKTNG